MAVRFSSCLIVIVLMIFFSFPERCGGSEFRIHLISFFPSAGSMTASASSFACHSDKISRCDTADRYQDLVRRSVPDRESQKEFTQFCKRCLFCIKFYQCCFCMSGSVCLYFFISRCSLCPPMYLLWSVPLLWPCSN